MKIRELEGNLFLLEFDVTMPFEQVVERLKLTDEEDIDEFRTLWNGAVEYAVPKVMYRICGVNAIQDDLVTVEKTVFKSLMLAENLAERHRAVAYVITCGNEVEEWSNKEPDFLLRMLLDVIKQAIFDDVTEQFKVHVHKLLDTEKVSAMNPGDGDSDAWPIAQQRELFALVGAVEEQIGVRLSDSCLMFPTKTVSGLFFPS